MISYHEAFLLLAAHAPDYKKIEVATAEARERFLAQDILAPMDLPPFDNSSVDGFALRAADLLEKPQLPMTNIIRAVGQIEPMLAPHTCAAIMTGAPIPAGADAVVMKEHAECRDNLVSFATRPTSGQAIREKGGDIKKGALVASKGSRVSPALIGVLLGLGIARVKVFATPRIAIICTGDELVNAPEPLKYGQVYFLLGAMLEAQCQSLGLNDVCVKQVQDDKAAIEAAINHALGADIIIITGGMSEGDRDLVRPALARCGVSQIFWRGSWRPGKPLYFGAKDQSRIFGLPGNPVASFVGFRIFIQAMLAHSFRSNLMGLKSARLVDNFEKPQGWTMFARAKVDGENNLTILPNQDSHQIFALSQSNALCLIEAPTTIVKAGACVHYYPL